MSQDSSIDQATIRAYLETHYVVRAESPVILRIGEASPGLALIHRSHRVDCSAFLTACNPFSRPFDDAANAARQAALQNELSRRSLIFLPGIGQHPSNEWPGEDSFLVLGLTLEAAKVLGSKFEQNGFVWSGTDAVAQLILLR